jgi:hypothetical protein
MATLVRELFDGPLDVVGDVHGEIGALDALLERLGYDREGRHRDGRRLVFVGDLVDRGEDSPAVVERVAGMVEAGRAQCVLGNHELNLVLGLPKAGNGWFQPKAEDHDLAKGRFQDAPRASQAQREAFLAWFGSLPLALERPGLRVVHACWDDLAVDRLRSEVRPLPELYADWSGRVDAGMLADGTFEVHRREIADWGDALHDRSADVPLLPCTARIEANRQTAHPVKLLTSGPERPTARPFFANGKWRMCERVPWWEDYSGPRVVVGHYWRWPHAAVARIDLSKGPDLFAGAAHDAWLGPRGAVMCVDWCAGLNWKHRKDPSHPPGVLGALAVEA